jgi:hypothetical protein
MAVVPLLESDGSDARVTVQADQTGEPIAQDQLALFQSHDFMRIGPALQLFLAQPGIERLMAFEQQENAF